MADVGPLRGGANDHRSVNIRSLADSTTNKLEDLPILSTEYSIYRVPSRLRKINDAAYTPVIVSIGPFHHREGALQLMEEHKLRYLKDFLDRTELNLENAFRFVKQDEDRIRKCYSERISLPSQEFLQMIVVDAIFIIEFLLRYKFDSLRKNEHIFTKSLSIVVDINHDLLLLENQLPYFVLERLFEMAVIEVPSDQVGETTNLCGLTINWLKTLGALEVKLSSESLNTLEVKHLTDLLWRCHVPSSQENRQKREVVFVRSVTELHKAGVKFKAGNPERAKLLEIKFDEKNGELEIPHIKIHDDTESRLRNLVAFEQCHHKDRYMSDYVAFVDSLVNTSEDVELLVRSRVIQSWLGHYQDVSNVFNSLGTEITLGDEFYFSQISERLNKYCDTRWHRWKATLRHEYFKTPWRVLSIGAAFILLILTFIQTVCSIISVVQ